MELKFSRLLVCLKETQQENPGALESSIVFPSLRVQNIIQSLEIQAKRCKK